MTEQTVERRAFNLKEAARMVGLSENTLRRELIAGRLRHARAGRRVLISERAINEFINADASSATHETR